MTRVKKISQSSSPPDMEAQKPSLPGPTGLPAVGSLLEWKGPQTNLLWTKTFGDIYRVKMGSKDLVYLNSLELIQTHLEGRKGEKFLDRPMGPAAIGEGLLFGSGESWKKNKKAMMKALHTQTFKPHMEAAATAEIRLALDALDRKTSRHRFVKPGDVLLGTCANAVAGLLVGGALPEISQDRKDLIKVAKGLEGVDLSSMLTQITLKHPKLREPLSKILFTDIVDVHGTSRRLQRLIRHWIRQAKSGTLTPTPTNPKPLPIFLSARPTRKSSSSSSVISDEDSGISVKCPRLNSTSDRDTSLSDCEETSDFSRDEDTDATENSMNSSVEYTSEENLLTTYKVDALIEQAMRNTKQLALFGFSETGHGEMPFEVSQVPEAAAACPQTPLTETQWCFQRQMSVNPAQDSILQRLTQQPDFAFVTEENDEELLQSVIDMFFGGVTSTLSALEFTLYYLTQNPLMQAHAQEHIDRVMTSMKLGADDMVTWEMHEQLPYIRACITESLRLGAVTPSSLPHVAKEDTEIEGYKIPQGTMVMGSIISIHNNAQHFPEPTIFRPQRHLDNDRQYKKPESYRPYGIGGRRCVGDQMSEMQLFIYVCNILRHFTLKPTGNKRYDSLDTHMRIIHRLKDFRCVMERRTVQT